MIGAFTAHTLAMPRGVAGFWMASLALIVA